MSPSARRRKRCCAGTRTSWKSACGNAPKSSLRKNDQLREQRQTLRQMIATHERYRQLLAYEIHDTFVQDVIAR